AAPPASTKQSLRSNAFAVSLDVIDQTVDEQVREGRMAAGQDGDRISAVEHRRAAVHEKRMLEYPGPRRRSDGARKRHDRFALRGRHLRRRICEQDRPAHLRDVHQAAARTHVLNLAMSALAFLGNWPPQAIDA